MTYRISKILIATAAVLFSAPVALAQTADIQMLPPTDFNSATPCNMGSNLNQVLVFNPGASAGSAINCNLKFTADSNGYVSAGGFWAAPSPAAGFSAYDRQADVANNAFMGASVFYRDSDITSLWDSTAGNVMSFNTTGKVTFTNDVTVGSTLNINGARLFLNVDGSPSGFAWIGAQGSGTDAQRVGLGINADSGTGIVNYLAANAPLRLGTGTCTQPGQIQWDSTNAKVQYCDGTTWKNLGGLARTWHAPGIPPFSNIGVVNGLNMWATGCILNDTGNEMIVSFGGSTSMGGIAIQAGSGACDSYWVGGPVVTGWLSPPFVGAQGSVPDGWSFRLVALGNSGSNFVFQELY